MGSPGEGGGLEEAAARGQWSDLFAQNKASAGIKRHGERTLDSRVGPLVDLDSREGRGCRVGGLCHPISLQAEENRIKLPQVTERVWSPCSVHLPVGFVARAAPGGREGTWQRRQQTSLSRAREKILLWVHFPEQTCLPAL